MIKEQDDGLDLLGASVGRIGELARDLGNEITLQNKMIGDLDEDMEQVFISRHKLLIIQRTREPTVRPLLFPLPHCVFCKQLADLSG